MINIWQIQALGALYLLFISINHIVKKLRKNKAGIEGHNGIDKRELKKAGFWITVIKVELAGIAFVVDSILAALAVALPETNLPAIGGLDGGQFLVIFAGGVIGFIIMRFAANFFVTLLQCRPGLEIAAFLIVGWVGVKLAITTLPYEAIHILPYAFARSAA